MPSPCMEAGRGRWKNFGPKIYLYLSKQAYIHKSSLYEMETIFYLLYNIRGNAIPPPYKGGRGEGSGGEKILNLKSILIYQACIPNTKKRAILRWNLYFTSYTI